jgi:hypothetical protein
MLDDDSPSAIAFRDATDNLIRNIAIRNATMPPAHKTVAAAY